MAITLGKRKRREEISREETTEQILKSRSASPASGDEAQRMQEIFRKHFEARFKPLAVEKKAEIQPEEESSDEEESEDEWGGLSDDEGRQVEVVEHNSDTMCSNAHDRDEMKAFMSSKPPVERPKAVKKATKASNEDDEDSAQNLKNDLALQRLLSESHLLSRSNTDDLQASGKARLKAIDMRFQTLGSKESLYTTQKMPMSMRKGMTRKKEEVESKRRKNAKEANIVLEREVRKKQAIGRRDRGVGAPGVGRFKGGVLKLSQKDVREIQSTRAHGPKRKR